MNDLMMSVQAREQHWSSAIDVTVIRLVTACKHQRFHAVDAVISDTMNNLTYICAITAYLPPF